MAAIYQRARPVTFAQVIGQEHVKTPLQAALAKGRVGHAYLFSGPRGVGKTTTARLLAMAVNCESDNRPCGECESCLLVRRGTHPDVTELDAASNNSVEDIRDLREKVRLASLRGGRRVWVLDEAHMLSKSASNALLKTLEEPPEGLVFILATTEPEKLPPTILSRTQHFRFRRLSEVEIASKLRALCHAAGVDAEEGALALVARAADGAMRDAESLLERLLTTGAPITLQDAERALGLPPQVRLQTLARHLAAGDLGALFAETSALYRDGFAPRTLAERLAAELRGALYARVGLGGDFTLDLSERDLLRALHALDDEMERFVRYDDLFSLEVALIKTLNALTYNTPSEAVTDATPRTPAAGAETSAPAQPAPDAPPFYADASAPAPAGSAARAPLPDFDPTGRPAPLPPRPRATPPPTPPPPSPTTPAPTTPTAASAATALRWRDVTAKAGVQLRAFLNDARVTIEEGRVHLKFAHDFHYKETVKRQAELVELIAQASGQALSLELESPKGELLKKP
jgi:DNA polymerase-3 subunit gamma/tau